MLEALQHQSSAGAFTYSIVVVDNDLRRSAEAAVEEVRRYSRVEIRYDVEPQRNIALARNRAVAHAVGEFVAFIDDDETPVESWLESLYRTWNASGADGVLGPVVPSFESNVPQWVLRGRFFDRPRHQTGEPLDWKRTRTGNVLLKRSILEGTAGPFDSRFGRGGEDTDLFRRLTSNGCRFVWCDEAVVYEQVTARMCRRSYLLRRALLRGRQPYFATTDFAKSLLAVPVYTVALPVLLLAGHHVFMKYLIKDCDHIGRLLALCRIDPIKETYVSAR